jgi:hypothetical protein
MTKLYKWRKLPGHTRGPVKKAQVAQQVTFYGGNRFQFSV